MDGWVDGWTDEYDCTEQQARSWAELPKRTPTCAEMPETSSSLSDAATPSIHNTHDVTLFKVVADPPLKIRIARILDELKEHYRCRYVLISFSDDEYSHIPCVQSDDSNCRELFPPKLAHFRETSFCQQTLHRPIPVIIPSLMESAIFREHPYVVGHPEITSYVGMPIIIDDEYVGALCMFWTVGACVDDLRAYVRAEAAVQMISSLLRPHRLA